MNPETWAEIRRLALMEKLSGSEIARRLVLDRKTVRRALLSDAGPPGRAAAAARPTKLESFKSYVGSRLKEYPRISAARLFEEIRQMGYGGGITILKEYVATLRPSSQEAFFRLETRPGEQGQVDWANCGVIRIGAAVRKLSAFVMVLSYSRLMYVEFTLSQCLEDFLSAHLGAFRFFGGIPRKILYDNLKSVCLSRFGPAIAFNPKFLEFSGVCLFEPVLCRPARGNEKGKVESGIKYLRSSFLEGRELLSWPGLQSEISAWLRDVANVRIHGTTRERPIDRFEAEKSLLAPLPAHEPDVSICRPVKATSQSLVHFGGNAYSVPFVYAGKVLTLRADKGGVRVHAGAKCIATHPRSFERGVVIEIRTHYEGLLATKKAAQAAKSVEHFLALSGASPEAKGLLETYLKGLMAAELNVASHLGQILELSGLYGKTEVIAAIAAALEFKAFGAGYLKNMILQQRAARGLKEELPVVIAKKPAWCDVAVEEQDLSLYDDLFEEEPAQEGEAARGEGEPIP